MGIGAFRGVGISIGALVGALAASQHDARGRSTGEVMGGLTLVVIGILLALVWIATSKHGTAGRKKGAAFFTVASVGFGLLCVGAVASSGAISWHEIWFAWIAYALFVVIWWVVPWQPRSPYA